MPDQVHTPSLLDAITALVLELGDAADPELIDALRRALVHQRVTQAQLGHGSPNLWELEELKRAWEAGNLHLAYRYLGKALERVRCMICLGRLESEPPYRPHYEGFAHFDCIERYQNRRGYLLQHEQEIAHESAAVGRIES